MRGSVRATALLALVLSSLCLVAGGSFAQSVPSQREVEEGLTCQCGCGLTVAACNHLECSFAVPVRKDVGESLAGGETREQILERYKNKYGEKVLSSPVPEGFNLLAWIGPYAGIFLAGLLMFTFFRRRAVTETPQPDLPVAGSRTDDRIAELQRDVEELER